MWRIGGHHRHRSHSSKDFDSSNQIIAVAIDSNKNSQHALKWASDHLIPRSQSFILFHVRKHITTIPTPTGDHLPISEVDKDVATTFLEQLDQQTKELLLPFQCYCRRRGLHCNEVVVDGEDVSKTIIAFIKNNMVDKLVLGSSSRNAFTRTFRPDVPTCVSRMIPEFCSMYVVSKGKLSSIRPASKPNKHPILRQSSDKLEMWNSTHPKCELDHTIPMDEFASIPKYNQDGERDVSTSSSFPSPENEDLNHPTGIFQLDPFQSPIVSNINHLHHHGRHHHLHLQRDNPNGGIVPSNFHNMNKGQYFLKEQHKITAMNSSDNSDLTCGVEPVQRSPLPCYLDARGPLSTLSLEDMEAEMRRLKLELKQSIDAYNQFNGFQEILNSKQARNFSLRTEEEHGMGSSIFQQATMEVKEERQKSTGFDGREKLVTVENDTNFIKMIPCRIYTIKEIEMATDNFSESLKIGEGGYGPVFKSVLDHTVVAIKILTKNISQGMKQFQREVEVLSCIRHPNMVLLMGACPNNGCLVYEYMSNGSLEDRLFRRSNTPPLSWQLRFKIAAEIATGLLFLHQTKPEPLVHRDLKPANILLDHNFVSKIADVGLSRLLPPSVADSVTQYRMTAAAGTFCYIDPEYQKTGMLGIKSDIYALGIILLQLLTAQPPMGLAHNVETALETENLKSVLDPSVADWPMEETTKFAVLALKCAELRRKDRPDLATVLLPELNRMKMIGEAVPENPTLPVRGNARHYQEEISIPCIEEDSRSH